MPRKFLKRNPSILLTNKSDNLLTYRITKEKWQIEQYYLNALNVTRRGAQRLNISEQGWMRDILIFLPGDWLFAVVISL